MGSIIELLVRVIILYPEKSISINSMEGIELIIILQKWDFDVWN